MPRPKGSKNKKKIIEGELLSVEQYDEKIVTLTAEIENLTETLKTKKAELKELEKGKEAAVEAAAAQKAEEEKKKILDAVAASGKSLDEILELLK
ncbi:MAG: hypothetical protein E7337_14015 [Clostridiales bacterium]|nr:hypothetical protein [Clostridiales bacterium]